MTERRQVWAGLALFMLSLAVPVAAITVSRPGAGWEAAALVTTALLLAMGARRLVVVPRRSAVTRPVTGPDAVEAPVLFRLSPDAPGRPEQPRAPGRAIPRASAGPA